MIKYTLKKMINETWLGKSMPSIILLTKNYDPNIDILMFDIKTNNFFFGINSIKKMYEVDAS